MKKHSYNHVKKYIEGFEYQLISKEYMNNKTKLDLVCSEGHSFEITYSNFQHGHRCPKCFGTPKNSFIHVKKYIEEFGYQLVSKEYRNNSTKMELVCPEKHHFTMSYHCFKRGNRCPDCYNKNRKYSYNHVKKYIEGFEYQLVSKEYKNVKTKLNLICPQNHSFEMKYNDFQQGIRCPECAKSMVTSKGEKEVLNFVQSIYDGKIVENDRSQIINPLTGRYLELDIFLPEINKAIEYNGIYWHSKKEKIDELKQTLCSEKRIKLLVIEEKEWTENRNFVQVQVESFIF